MSNTQVQTEEIVKIRLGEFRGAFGGFQSSAFIDLKAAGLEPKIAHKIAFDYGSDVGNAIRNAGDDGLATKVAKAKKGGESRISLSGGGSTMTSRSMSLIRLAQLLAGMKKETLIASAEIDEDNLPQKFTEYLSECAEWADAQTFA